MEPIPVEVILQAKQTYGEKAIEDICDYFDLQKFDTAALKASCPLGTHVDDTPSFIWNPKEFCFHCFSCGQNFGILDLKMRQGMTFIDAVAWLFKETGSSYRIQNKGLSRERSYRYPSPVPVHNGRKTVNQYWESRGISPATLDFCDVSEDQNGNTVFHFFNQDDVLMTIKYRPSHKVAKGETKFWTNDKDHDKAPVLYGMNKIDPSKPLLITEGEPDRIAAIEAGFTNAVSIPFGAADRNWIKYNYDWLQQFSTIIVWSDNDEAGIKMRKDACFRLGIWRTKYVDLPKTIDGIPVKDINEVLFHFGKQRVLSLIDDASEPEVQNAIALASVEDFDISKAEGIFTPFPTLNEELFKIVMGTVVIVTGKTGAGKSSVINQLFVAQALQEGQSVFVYSGEIGKPMYKRWLDELMLGRDFIRSGRSKHEKVLDPEARANLVSWYGDRLFIYDNPKDNTADTILTTAESVVMRHGAKVIVLDNLMTIDIGETSERDALLKQKEFIVRLWSFADTFGVIVVLVAHPRKTAELRRIEAEDVAGSANIGNLAHYIFSIHRYSQKEKKGIRSANGGYKIGHEPIPYDSSLDVFKNRITGSAGFNVPLYFDFISRRSYEEPKGLWFRYGWDARSTPVPTHDPNDHNPAPVALGGHGD